MSCIQFNSVHALMNSLELTVSEVSEAVARVFGDQPLFLPLHLLCSFTLYPTRVVILNHESVPVTMS